MYHVNRSSELLDSLTSLIIF